MTPSVSARGFCERSRGEHSDFFSACKEVRLLPLRPTPAPGEAAERFRGQRTGAMAKVLRPSIDRRAQ